MDDVTKQERRSSKASVAKFLKENASVLLGSAALEGADPRLFAYLQKIVSDPDRHNLFELLAVRRFFSFLGRYNFLPGKIRKVITCIEALKFPGPSGLSHITLSPVQVFILCGIYGFYMEDGRRVTRNVLLFVPRKFGKTTFIAGIAIYEMLFGDADGQVYACANSYNQAKICFNLIRKALKVLDKTGKRFRVNREIVYPIRPGLSSFAQCLASDASTLDGLNASCYILDEFAQAKDASLRNVMSTSTGTRENPLELIITTASEVQDGPCASTLSAYQDILMGKASDDSVFAVIFTPDVDDAEDDPATWAKVQPHLGVTVQQDYYERQWEKAQQTAENMLAFRTKLLNIFVTDVTRQWLTGDEIRDLYRPFSWDALDGTNPPLAMVSFDLSVWNDFSCVCYQIYNQESGTFHFHLDYYLPQGTLANHANAAVYQQWADDGYLILLPGDVIDYDLIVRDIITRNGKIVIAGIGYDPYKAKTAVNLLTAAGAGNVLQPIKQTYGNFTGSVEALELMVKTKVCSFTPNPITAWCFGNCCMDEDKLGNRKPIKGRLSAKIDGAVCALMTQNMCLNFKRSR